MPMFAPRFSGRTNLFGGRGPRLFNNGPKGKSIALINGFPPVGVWSLRRLVSTYSGPVITLTDGTNTANIGFDNDDLDADAVLAAQTAGMTQVLTWYDQSDFALHLTQSNPAKRPTVLLNGTSSHYPAIQFPGTSVYLDAPASQAVNNLWDAANAGGYMAMGLSVTGGNGFILSKGQNYLQAATATSLRMKAGYSGAGGTYTIPSPATWHTFEAIYNDTGSAARPYLTVDNIPNSTVETAPTGTRTDDSASVFRVGADSTGAAGFQGLISEILLFKGIPA